MHFFPVFCFTTANVSARQVSQGSALRVFGVLLNFKSRNEGVSTCVRGSIFTSMVMVLRALGGRSARKFRATLPERALKGEKVVRTPVRYLVSILDGGGGEVDGRGVDGVRCLRSGTSGIGSASQLVWPRRFGRWSRLGVPCENLGVPFTLIPIYVICGAASDWRGKRR